MTYIVKPGESLHWAILNAKWNVAVSREKIEMEFNGINLVFYFDSREEDVEHIYILKRKIAEMISLGA